MPAISEPDLEPWNIAIATIALLGIIAVMVAIAVCLLATKQEDDEDIELQQIDGGRNIGSSEEEI